MKTVLHKSGSRGYENNGWLETYYSFSFANYYNPLRMHFGVLRVLNDDNISAGKGFGNHPHDNMEIVTILLKGELEHKDNMGNSSVIKTGDIQVMSAGTGIFHSEYNRNQENDLKLLQIWLYPNKKNVVPRYDQLSFIKGSEKNKFQQILSPNQNDAGVWIHQNAWFYLGEFESEQIIKYVLNDKKNGVYIFILDGIIEIEGQILNKRDGFGVVKVNEVNLSIKSFSKILLMEIPMTIS